MRIEGTVGDTNMIASDSKSFDSQEGRIENERAGGAPVRVLYSFPLKIGAARICTTAWYQVSGLANAGVRVTVFPAAICRAFPASINVRPTLAWGKYRLPNRLLGRIGYAALHDWIVARRLEKMARQIDIVHTWPLGARHTLKTAARLGIPTVLERPNAHTKFAYKAVEDECRRLGLFMPKAHEHAYNPAYLRIEEEEYRLADHLLCPSDFVSKTFLDEGFPPQKLARHQYGFDNKRFYPAPEPREKEEGLKILFAGGCAPRKGLHYALEAWMRSSAWGKGTFQIAGEFIPGYAEKLVHLLAHPSIKVLGHRSDLDELMRNSDILVLPSIEEGSALVTSEARGSGCVLLVSESAGAICEHNRNALVHSPGDVESLARHIAMLDQDRALLKRLRTESLRTVSEIDWNSAGKRLLQVYQRILKQKALEPGSRNVRSLRL